MAGRQRQGSLDVDLARLQLSSNRRTFDAPFNSQSWFDIKSQRNQARDYARTGVHLSRAAEYEKSQGNRRRARSLSQQAKACQREKSMLDKTAAYNIVRSNSKRRGDVDLDLHYTYVSDAKPILDEHLQNMQAAGHDQTIIDTGRGNRGNGSLKHAIKTHLDRNGHEYDQIRPGVFRIYQ